MSSKREVFENFKLYAVTDIKDGSRDILDRVEAAYRGGADIVQLRAKQMPAGELLLLAARIRRIAEKAGKLFFVNDRPDIAIAAEADGVHVGQDDMPVERVRQYISNSGFPLLIGKSTHTVEQAVAAETEGVDYIGVGPVFQTPTKPDYAPAGLEFVKQVSERIKLPFVCIGGIDLNNIEQVLAAGAKRIAVVRAIFSSEDPYESARQLRGKIESFVHA